MLTNTEIETIRLLEEDIPLGQRILSAGYKVITKEQLEERFCCDKITEGERQKAVALLEEKIKIYRNSHWWRKRAHITFKDRYDYIFISNGWETFKTSEHYLTCQLEDRPLDDYVADKIPDRCLIQVKKARSLGIIYFNVVYPVLKKRQLKDPIIVGSTNDNFDPMYEIDFWE